MVSSTDRAKPVLWFLDLLMWWRRLQRRIDRHVLIPAMERQAKDDFQLAAAFALHMAYDRAWQVVDWEYDEWEWNFLNRLNAA